MKSLLIGLACVILTVLLFGWPMALVVFAIITPLLIFVNCYGKSQKSKKNQRQEMMQEQMMMNENNIIQDNLKRVEGVSLGMLYSEVVERLGGEGLIVGETATTKTRTWYLDSQRMYSVTMTFEEDKVISKDLKGF